MIAQSDYKDELANSIKQIPTETVFSKKILTYFIKKIEPISSAKLLNFSLDKTVTSAGDTNIY